ncbi:Holliday junction resolvase RuvX [Eupransor demetentiae]|uniref:Putative pre-16S rRNA nuclease n=1 Tax=Eupransor demetentiae TaxID=3109584 RepID=A0ABM9N372_9LACO|nr:YqgF/RuvX protein [Lactobacillaceae bacterium LMG 33000]
MRLLGLDVGSKTVGVSVSDPMGWTAQGVEIIRIDEEAKEFGLDRLGEIIKEKQAKGVVLGLPKNMNNTEGPRVDASRAYGKMVEERFGLPIDFQDERLTTVQAERMLVEEADVSRKKRKKVIDKLAAELILQNYLDAHGKLTQGLLGK